MLTTVDLPLFTVSSIVKEVNNCWFTSVYIINPTLCLQMLLEDPVPTVRSQAVLGVFRIMSLFWELMPSVTIKNIVTKVMQDLAFDSASADVRESVVKVM